MCQFSKNFLALDIDVCGQYMISNAEIEVKNGEPLFYTWSVASTSFLHPWKCLKFNFDLKFLWNNSITCQNDDLYELKFSIWGQTF